MKQIRFDKPQIHLTKDDWDCRVFAVPEGLTFDPAACTDGRPLVHGPCLCTVVTDAGETTVTRFEIDEMRFWRWLTALLRENEPDARLVAPADER